METADGVVVLSPRTFCLWWWFSTAYHLFNAMFAALLAFSHLIIGSPAVYANIWMLAISQRTLVVAGWTYAGLAALQLLIVARHIVQSLREGRLSFGYRNQSDSKQARAPSPTRRTFQGIWRRSKPKGVGQVNAAQLEVMFELRQLVEIVLQTYQANQLSQSVARPELQLFVVVAIVVNCVHTPLLDASWRWRRRQSTGESEHLQRLVILIAVDVWLDFLITVVLPIFLLLPRLLEFDFAAGQFPSRLAYNDAWNVRAINEGRQILVTSSLDFVSSILPLLLGIVNLRFIKSKLRCRLGKIVPRVASNKELHSVTVGFLAASDARTRKSQSQALKAALTVIRLVGCGWAVLVIALHAQAQKWNRSVVEGCLVVFPAWLTSRAPCAALQFNCYARGEIGSSQEIHKSLVLVERSTLRSLVFSHCPALEIPSIVTHEFFHLNAIGMFNCTIRTWDVDAAISHRLTPTLALLQLLDTNMTGIPDGFAHAELPPVFSLNLYRSNLSSLPETIGDTWGQVGWSTLWLDYTQLTSLPESFSRVKATKLSFEGSPVASLPPALLQQHPFSLVRLSNTRLRELPPAMDDTSHLSMFLAENTEVEQVPEWLRSWASASSDHVVSLRGSPACELDPVANAPLCHEMDATIQKNSLPYEIIAAQRPLKGR